MAKLARVEYEDVIYHVTGGADATGDCGAIWSGHRQKGGYAVVAPAFGVGGEPVAMQSRQRVGARNATKH